MKPIEEVIKDQRLKANMTQSDLAALVGTTQSAIARLESGRSQPTTATLRKVGEALHLDLSVEFEQRGDKPYNSDSECFIIGPIGDRYGELGSEGLQEFERAVEVLERVILPACAQVGLRAIRADDIAQPGEIPEQVVRKLRSAEVVIADLTGTNANVMYELGLRHSTYLTTIPIAERSEAKGLPFDVASLRTILYKPTDAGLARARNDLIRALRAAAEHGYNEPTATRVFWEDRRPTFAPTPAIDQLSSNEDEAPGLAELLADMEDALPEMNRITEEMGASIGSVGNATSSATERLTASDARGGGFKGRLPILHLYGQDLGQIVGSLEPLADTFGEKVSSVSKGLQALDEALERGDIPPDGLDEFGHNLESMANAIDDSVESSASLLASLDVPERASSQIAPKIRRLKNVIRRVMDDMKVIRDSARRVNRHLPQ